MDKKYIEENEIEIKYLRNQLTPEELEEFEVYLMENPEALQRIQIDRVFSDNFNQIDIVDRSLSPLSKFYAGLLETKVFTSAFSFCLGLLSMWVLVSYATFKPGAAQVAYFSEIRGAGELPVVRFGVPEKSFSLLSRDQIILVIDSGLSLNSDYSGTVLSKTERGELAVRVASRYRTDQFGSLIIPLFIKSLSEGEHQIHLSPHNVDNQSSPSLKYRFYLKREELE